MVKNLPANPRDIRDKGLISELGSLSGVGNATHSSILALKIPCTEESGRLLPMGPKESDAIEHTPMCMHTPTHTRSFDVGEWCITPPFEVLNVFFAK